MNFTSKGVAHIKYLISSIPVPFSPVHRFSGSLRHFSFFFVSVSLLLVTAGSHAQVPQIFMDGKFDDWQTLSPLYQDAAKDQLIGHLDFGKLWITNDASYLYISVEVGTEMNLQNDNEIALYLDTDNIDSTGEQFAGIGAELIYRFGSREGTFVNQSDRVSINHYDIGLVTLPTVTSDKFEIAISRVALPDRKTPLFANNTIRVSVVDIGKGRDRLPNHKGGIRYTFTDQVPDLPASISIKKDNPNSFRMMTYNVLSDGLFKPGQTTAILRILKAINPEIIGFQEIYSHSAEDVIAKVETVLPPSAEWKWHGTKASKDIIVISRYPIETTHVIEENGAFLIDLAPKFDTKLLVVGAHFACCENNAARQLEIDAMMGFIRDAKAGNDKIILPQNTPIIMLGDFNLVGYAQQLNTLLTGDIVNQHLYGEPFSPDWDNTDFTDLLPRCTDIPFSFTWYDPDESYSPGKLDYMIYSDNVIQPVKKFILFTPAISPDALSTYDLKADDTMNATDHLPVVADFVLIED